MNLAPRDPIHESNITQAAWEYNTKRIAEQPFVIVGDIDSDRPGRTRSHPFLMHDARNSAAARSLEHQRRVVVRPRGHQLPVGLKLTELTPPSCFSFGSGKRSRPYIQSIRS